MNIELEKHKHKVHSQRGEDGIIQKVFDTLNITKGHCVELGAWDGIYLSNTYNLIKKGWSATLIEGGKKKFKELKHNMKAFPKVHCFNRMVNLKSDNSLDYILKADKVAPNFDFLSLDLDGCDYWVWNSLTFKPKLVIIEYNPNFKDARTIPYNSQHSWDGTKFYGASSLALKKLGDIKGYDLVAQLPYINMVFIHKDYNKGRFKEIEINDRFFHNTHKPMSIAQQEGWVINPRTL